MLVLIYITITVVVVGTMLFDAMIWSGIVLLVGSVLGFSGGSGMRGALYLRQRKSGIVMGFALLAAGMALVFYADVTMQAFGTPFSGDVWVFAGFAIGFLAARPSDAGVEAQSANNNSQM